MPVFEYNAISKSGKQLRGIVDARSVTDARQKLREREAYPVSLRETSAEEEKTLPAGLSPRNLFRKIGQREVTVMTRQLATLLGAGIPLVPALNALVLQTPNPALKKTLAQIKERVNEGNSLGRSLGTYGRVFSPFYVNMVLAGEESGALDVVLERLAEFTEKQRILRDRVRAALTYPFFMFLVGIVVLFVLTVFVVPQITAIFDEMNQALPTVTVFLITTSSLIQSYWLVVLGGTIGIAWGLSRFFNRTHRGLYMRDLIKLRTPVTGPLIHKIIIARFCRTLATLLGSGVPLLNALAVVRNVVDNRLIADVVGNAGKDVAEGKSLSATLAQSPFIPPLVVQMISVGEQSGALEEMLSKIAEGYEQEAESSILQIMSLLEPVMILVMGLFVGFIVISILLPIFEMNQLIR